MVQNHTRGPFNPKYVGHYCVVSLKGNQVEVQPSTGGPTGRKATLRMNPDKIPDLHWKLANTYHTTNIGQINLKLHVYLPIV